MTIRPIHLNEKKPVKIDFDVDIDLPDRQALLEVLPHVPASIRHPDGTVTRHNTGVYLQHIPQLPVQGISALDYREAEEQGWFKFDLLNNSIYAGVRDSEHLSKLVQTEPVWQLLEHAEVVQQLAHINNYADLVRYYKPRSLSELAMVIAVIRPGKRHLVGHSFEEMQSEIWRPPADGSYYYKKSHSYAFALSIIVQLNLLVEQSMQSCE